MAALAGRCIVTTRPAGQETGLGTALTAYGAQVFNFPVIAIEAADPAPLRALTLADFDLAFFVSPNAVSHALSIRARAEWPASLRVATVGPASAEALRARGFPDAICPATGFDSEAVLALAEFAPTAIAGRRVLVLRGNGGRDLLSETLRERGATVEPVCCYRRVCARLDPQPLLERCRTGLDTALVFSASEAVRYFCQILGPEAPRLLATLPCFAPHPRICAALREAGAPAPFLTASGDSGIAASLAEVLGTSDNLPRST